jgi:HemY protein
VEPQDHEGLQAVWYHIPKALQSNEDILTAYIQRLINQGKSDIAEPLLRNALKHYWSEPLMHLYGLIDSVDVNAQITYAESCLKTHENNAVLLLTLGRLCLRAGLWGKARAYLEASVGAEGLPEAYNELGHLLEKMGEKEKAIECFRNGLRNAPGCEKIISRSAAAELEHKSGNNNNSLLTESSLVAR